MTATTTPPPHCPPAVASPWRRARVGRRRRERRGAALVYLTVMLAALCAFALLSVDLGRAMEAKFDLQATCDAAARAAAHALSGGGSPAAARQAAADVVAANRVDGQAVTINPATDVTFRNWDATARTGTLLTGAAEANANAVQVALARTRAAGNPVTLAFGGVIGLPTADVHAVSTACAAGNGSDYAIVGINSLTVTGNASTDSYDSRSGPYSAATAHHKGSIASNGNISLGGSARVDGDVRAGVGGSTTTSGAAQATGRVAPLGAPLNYPSVTLPSSYVDAGDLVMKSGKVSLVGGVYVFDTIDLSGNAQVTWTGPVVIYVRKAYNVSGNAVVDTYQGLPANQVINFLPTCTSVTWTGNNACVGELYAPDTDFSIDGNAELFGRIIARTVSISASASVHYDEAMPPADPGAKPSGIVLVK
jgi:Flp pilus assembly protein TadG